MVRDENKYERMWIIMNQDNLNVKMIHIFFSNLVLPPEKEKELIKSRKL